MKTRGVWGAGGKPLSNGDPPEARLVCRGERNEGMGCSVRREEAVRVKADVARGGWADVARRRPRPALCSSRSQCSFEGLVLSEIRDGKPKRVDGNEFVGNFALKDEDKICGVEITLDLGMVAGRVVNHVEIDASFEGR